MASGKFIVIEGLDGCGKSTQAALLCRQLEARGVSVLHTAEPTTGETGKFLRRILAGEVSCHAATVAALFAADRVEHNLSPDGIQAHLQKGSWVVCDRYYYSSMAYQGIEADFNWVKRLNVENPYIRKPDCCLFLEAPAEVCLSRIQAGRSADSREIFENRETLARIRARFEAVFAALPADSVIRIDASAGIDAVSKAIWTAVQPLLAAVPE